MAPEGARSMHPALGAWTGIKNLTSPEALKKQRAADDLIMSKMPAIQSSLEDPNIDWNKIFFQSGWTKSPVTGFGREIPDTGLSIISGRLHHPEGNIMGALNIDPRIKWQSPKQLGSPTFLGGFRSNVSPAELHLSKSLRNTPGYLHDTLAERAQIYPDYNFPWENLLRGTAAHELQHGAQHFEGNLRPTYNWRVPWAERPHEREARATELRALNPESYVSPFQGTLSNLNYGDFKEHILDKIKGR
jgi:hypothetical protein